MCLDNKLIILYKLFLFLYVHQSISQSINQKPISPTE